MIEHLPHGRIERVGGVGLLNGHQPGRLAVKDDVIYGDVENIAARLKSPAEPGVVCIFRHVYDHVKQDW